MTAWPKRARALVSICITNTLRDQLCSMALAAYQCRASLSVNLSSRVIWWYQGNCASTACTNSASGQAWAKLRMYLRLRGEKPFMSGKAVRKSSASRSITLAPQPSRLCRSKISRPICQYSNTSSRFTASAARCWALWMRVFRSSSQSV